jgi:hypothetical protein
MRKLSLSVVGRVFLVIAICFVFAGYFVGSLNYIRAGIFAVAGILVLLYEKFHGKKFF